MNEKPTIQLFSHHTAQSVLNHGFIRSASFLFSGFFLCVVAYIFTVSLFFIVPARNAGSGEGECVCVCVCVDTQSCMKCGETE